MDNSNNIFRLLVYSRASRSIALIYMTLAFSLYLTALGVDIIDIGIVAAITLLFMIFMVLGLGAMGDRYGYKYELAVAEIFSFLGALVIAVSTNTTFIIIGIIIAGLSSGAGGLRGAFSPGINAFIASSYPNQADRIKKFSVLTVVSAISAIFGSAMFGLVSIMGKYVGVLTAYRYLFFISAVMLAFSLICLLLLQERKRPAKTTKVMKSSSSKYISKVIIANSLGGMGMGLSIPLLPLWFKLLYNANPLQISAIFIISYIMTALGSYMSSRISYKIDALNMASSTRSLNGVFLIFMSLSPILPLSGFFYIFRAFFVGIGSPSRTAINIKGIHDEDYGTATSIQGAASRISQLSSGASGYLMDYSLPFPIFVGGVLQIASGIAYKLMFRNKQENQHM